MRAAALTLLACVAVAGCGDESTSDNDTATRPASGPSDVAAMVAAERTVKRRALYRINRTPDRNLPGPHRVKVMCSPTVNNLHLTCHVSLFTQFPLSPDGKFTGPITDEQWQVLLYRDGTVRRAASGDYYISRFLRDDDRRAPGG